MSQKLTLGYWNIRALADPIRFALEYAGADYQEKLYEMGQAPDFDRSQWTKDKFALGMDFPNLPYIIDGDLKLTESVACLRYVCRKYGLMPTTEKDIARADNVEGVLGGLKTAFFGQFFCAEEKYEETKNKYREITYPETMRKIIAFMGDNKWLVSKEITYVDFLFHTLLNYTECLNPSCNKEFPRIEKYINEFEALPAVKRYMSSDRFRVYPITNPFVRWGYTKQA